MANSFVGSLPTVGANNGGNVTLTFSNLRDAAGATVTLQQGDLVVCAYASSGTADFAMSTSSSDWTEVHEIFANGSANDTNLALYYKVMGVSPDTSFVAVGPTGNSNGTIGVAFAFRGIDAAVLDIAFVAGSHAASGTASTRPNAPPITPSTAGAWILVAGAGAAAAGSAFTNPGDLSATTNHFRSGNHAETIDIAIGIGIKTDWTSGAFDPAVWTGGAANAGDSWAAMVVALRPAPPAANAEPDDATHGHAADASAGTAHAVSAPAEAAHAHAADASVATAHAVASPAETLHGHTAEQPTATGNAQVVEPEDAAHGHTVDAATVTARAAAAPAEANHGHIADGTTATARAVASPAETLHGHSADSPTATGDSPDAAEPADALHGHTADAPSITAFVPEVPDEPGQWNGGGPLTTGTWTRIAPVAPAWGGANIPSITWQRANPTDAEWS